MAARRVCWVLVGVVLAGCGRLGFDSHSDAGGLGADGSDNPIDASGPLGPFSSPTPISELNTAAEDGDPSATADLLEIYFTSRRTGTQHIHVATRANADAPFGPATVVTEISSATAERKAEVSADGLTLYLASTRGGGEDIYVSVRPSRQDPWSTPVPVAELNSVGNNQSPGGGPSTGQIVLSSDRDGNQEIYISTRMTGDDPWSVPKAIAAIASPDREANAAVAGTAIVFDSNRNGTFDLWVSVSIAGEFGPPAALDEVNTPDAEETDPWLSPDQRTLLFSRAIQGSGDDLYISTR